MDEETEDREIDLLSEKYTKEKVILFKKQNKLNVFYCLVCSIRVTLTFFQAVLFGGFTKHS